MDPKRVNDVSIRVASVNGTGSQSANNILFKSLFRMGLGVCGKNLFPSNIQGLPTWFQIRVSPRGYQDLREHDDIAVLLNPETAQADLQSMRDGSTIFYNSNLIQPKVADCKPGMLFYPLPVEDLSRQITDTKLRPLLKNLFYVGALSYLYGIDSTVVTQVIGETFQDKQKAIDSNLHAFQVGMDFAQQNLQKQDAYEFRPDKLNEGKIILDGNAASGLGAIYAGCTFVAWYPITPSSSLAESMEGYLKKLRTDEKGKSKYAVIQAEDELASIGMVLGASWAGARSMTATAGPGISLMNEFLGLAYYAEIPAVIVDVQRVGPSTGLPTRTQQGDILACALASHGDTKHILLFPSSPKDCFELMQDAFDLADRFQTPVFFMSDLDLGMNNWVDQALEYKERKFDRGKILGSKDLEKLKGWGRYLDSDKDGIPYRTLPGTDHPGSAYFTRGTGHDEFGRYTENPHVYVRNMDRLLKKWERAKLFVPKPVSFGDPRSRIGILAYGTSHHAVLETLDRMPEAGLHYLQLKAYPFSPEVEKFIEKCDVVYVVEQNRDGQLLQLLVQDIPGFQLKMQSILYYGGFPLSADVVERELRRRFEEVSPWKQRQQIASV